MWRIVQPALMSTVVGARKTAFGDPPFPLTISSQYQRHLRKCSIMASPHEWKKVLITAIVTHRICDKLLCYRDGIPLNATRSFSTALYSVGHSPYHIINSWSYPLLKFLTLNFMHSIVRACLCSRVYKISCNGKHGLLVQ